MRGLLYLARMSVSIFTSEDGPLKLKVVFWRVWGITYTVKALECLFTTVRLIPSMATEPFGTINFKNSDLRVISKQRLPLLWLLARISPRQSICPVTKWPQSLSPTFKERSTFTFSPTLALPKLVSFAVSSNSSKLKTLPAFFTTVKHTPLTAILSPTFVSCAALSVWIDKISKLPLRSALLTCPNSSIIPVNIYTLFWAGTRPAPTIQYSLTVPSTRKSSPILESFTSFNLTALSTRKAPLPMTEPIESLPPIILGAIKNKTLSTKL